MFKNLLAESADFKNLLAESLTRICSVGLIHVLGANTISYIVIVGSICRHYRALKTVDFIIPDSAADSKL